MKKDANHILVYVSMSVIWINFVCIVLSNVQYYISIPISIVFTIIVIWIAELLIKRFEKELTPDEKEAKLLNIPIRRYTLYKKWYSDNKRIMETYGANSHEAHKHFCWFFNQIECPNEWRRFSDYQYKKKRIIYSEELNKRINEFNIFKHEE